MIATIQYNNRNFKIDFSEPLDISIPIHGDSSNVNAWDIEHPKITPHVEGEFIGKVTEGSSTNFNDIWFNPHAHGTHTECVGHITEAFYSINSSVSQFFYFAKVITIAPEKMKRDFVISKKQLQYALGDIEPQAVVIRTIPNSKEKVSKQYSNTNPPYLLEEAAKFMADMGVQHLLIDLPSIDKERDEGALLAHKAFWRVHESMRVQATITEFIYVNNSIKDGSYFLNLQIAPFENDASPSRPVLYKIKLE